MRHYSSQAAALRALGGPTSPKTATQLAARGNLLKVVLETVRTRYPRRGRPLLTREQAERRQERPSSHAGRMAHKRPLQSSPLCDQPSLVTGGAMAHGCCAAALAAPSPRSAASQNLHGFSHLLLCAHFAC